MSETHTLPMVSLVEGRDFTRTGGLTDNGHARLKAAGWSLDAFGRYSEMTVKTVMVITDKRNRPDAVNHVEGK